MDNTFYKMKESKLIKMSKQLEALKRVTQQLIKEIQINATMAGGTLEAFKIHVGEKEWELIVEELKDKEKRLQDVEQTMEKRS
jgi:hypothetical protein